MQIEIGKRRRQLLTRVWKAPLHALIRSFTCVIELDGESKAVHK